MIVNSKVFIFFLKKKNSIFLSCSDCSVVDTDFTGIDLKECKVAPKVEEKAQSEAQVLANLMREVSTAGLL